MHDRQIRDAEAFEAALAAPHYLLFKHSLACPISSFAFREYEAFLEANPGTPTGWIDVIGQRPWSLEVATRTGVDHASPQALWLREGAVLWSATHMAITQASLAEGRR
ncbi:MAG: bacillithiol system redox-active protein YtxJ [Planctomycetota bacterium]|jgi:bacillithiol system protein YtxJ